MPQISIAPVCTPPDGAPAPVGLFVDGILVRGLKALIADEGGDVLIVLDAADVAVDPRVRRRRLASGGIVPPLDHPGVVGERPSVSHPTFLRLATDGNA